MAQLKDTVVAGSLRVTDEALTNSLQTKIIKAPTSSGGTTYGVGSNGQVLKSNGTSVYWAADANSVTGVKGNSESSYRTGQVNVTAANVGAVAVSQGTGNAGRFLMVNSSGNVEATAVATKAATTYNTSTSDQTIAAGTYLTGAQTFKAVTTSNIDAGNIKNGVTVTVGDANSSTRIKNVTGTFTATPSGKTALTAAALRSGYAGFINGSQVNGSMPDATFANAATSGVTYTDVSSSAPVLVSGDYLYVNTGYTGNVKISLAKLVPDSINNVTTFAAAGQILSGYVAFNKDGAGVTGTIATKTDANLSASGKTVTVPAGYYASQYTKSVADGTITNNTTLPSGTSSSGTINRGSYIKIGAGYHTEKYYLAQNVSNGTITNNTTLPSGSSSSGTVNRGSYIKIGAGYYGSDAYYLAQANSGTKTITASGNTDVNGYATASVAAVSGSIGGSASGGSATAAISNVNSMNTISNVSGKTAGTDYWTVKATATGSAGSYTPKYTVSTAGWIASTVTGTAQSVSVSSDSTGKSIYIPKATFAKDGAKVYVSAAGYIPAGSASSPIATIGDGTVVASVSSNSGGSASMAATGFTAASSATSYYVTLSTSAGSVKAKAAGGTAGYVTSSTTNETAATSVSVSGNGNKLYVPAGGYSGSVSSHSITTTPVVTGSLGGTGASLGTTTKPSGTDGTDYWTFTPGGSVTTTGVSTAKGKATISTAGYIPAGNNESSAHTVNITPTASNGTSRYLTKATTSTSNGTATATNGTASTSVTGMVTTTTNTGYSVSASATGGNASVTASSATVGAGYNPSSVTASTTAKSATGTSASDTKYIQKGVLSASVSSNSGGSASMAATGFTAAGSATSYYVTLSTSAGSVKAKASVGTEGYVKSETNETAATSVSVSGNGTKLYIPAGTVVASVSSNTGGSASMAATGFTASSSATSYYVTLSTSAGSVKAKAVGGTTGIVTSSTTNETAATSVSVSGNGNKLYIPAGSASTSVEVEQALTSNTNNSGIAVTPKYTTTAGYVTAASNVAGTTRYINAIELPKGKTFSITVWTGASTQNTFTFTTDANGNTTVTGS